MVRGMKMQEKQLLGKLGLDLGPVQDYGTCCVEEEGDGDYRVEGMVPSGSRGW